MDEIREFSPYHALVHHPLPPNFHDPDQDPRRPLIQGILRRNFRAMILAYLVFTVGWLAFLFTPQSRIGAGLTVGAMGGFGLYSQIRNYAIRQLGFSRSRPFPSEWSSEFHDREPEIFKAFTTFWTFALFAWALLRFLN